MDFSLLTRTFSALRLDAPPRLVLLEARTLADAHFPPTPPDADTLILGVDSREAALQVKNVLLAVYPESHEVKIVEGNETRNTNISALDSFSNYSAQTCVFVPPLGEGTSFESFAEIVAHLRAPDGCLWDKEQTHQSLRKHLLEESYEALEAIDAGDFASMREEFGDLLLQIVLHAQIASEAGRFTMTDIVKGIHDKIVRRHPHVFGDFEVGDVNDVLQNWEKLKEKERGEAGEERRKKKDGLLDGVPLIMPALEQAHEYQDRAARVGFDWPEIEGVLDKIVEEIEEVKQATNQEELTDEIGDLIFALVNLARWKKVDAESALRGTNLKFKKRFAHIEAGARKQGRNLSDLSLDEMEKLWQEAKRGEGR
jgi:tetrapyrrole methylase family protein/MazG family protein